MSAVGDDRQPPVEAFTQQIGRFQIRRELGAGGFGKVYEAFDPRLGRTVALKVPTFPVENKRMLRRFITEARSAAKLHHPNIVAVYDNGRTEKNELFIVSEFVDGSTLRQLIAKEDVPLREKVTWIRDLAMALAYAHAEGVVHRDVKPENILVDRVQRRPKIVDFGLAKVRDEITRDQEALLKTQESFLGTPAFVAPEQARGEMSQVGPHSDQYSLGAVLYQCLTGEPPFKGSAYAMIAAVAGDDEPPPISQLAPTVPRDLAAICEKAMSKDAASRYAGAELLGDDLSRWLRDETVQARPVSRLTKLARWCRRNPALASLCGVLAVVLISATIILQNAITRANAEKRNADENALVAAERAREADAARVASEEATQTAQEQARIAQEKERLTATVLRDLERAQTEASSAKDLAADVRKNLDRATESENEAKQAKEFEEERRYSAEQVQRDLRLMSVMDKATSDYQKGLTVLESSPAHALSWMAKALEHLASQSEKNEPMKRLEEMLRQKVASELPRIATIARVQRLAHGISSRNYVAFSPFGRWVAVCANNSLGVFAADTGKRVYTAPIELNNAPAIISGGAKRDGDRLCNRLFFLTPEGPVLLFGGESFSMPASPAPLAPYWSGAVNSRIEVHGFQATPQRFVKRVAYDNAWAWFSPSRYGQGAVFVARKFQDKTNQQSRVMLFNASHDVNYEVEPGPEISSLQPANAVVFRRKNQDFLVATGRFIRRLGTEMRTQPPVIECDSAIEEVIMSPDDEHMAIATADGEVRLYRTDNAEVYSLTHGGQRVSAMEFSSDAQYLATGSDDGLARIWSTENGTLQGVPMLHPTAIHAVAFTGDQLLTVCQDGCLRCWQLPRVTSSVRLNLAKASAGVFLPNEHQLVVGETAAEGYGPRLHRLLLLDASSGAILAAVDGLPLPVTNIECPGAGAVVLASCGSRIHYLSPGNLQSAREPVLLPFEGAAADPAAARGQQSRRVQVRGMGTSDDGSVGACVLTDGRTYVWSDRKSGKIQNLGIDKGASVAVAPDGRSIAVGTADGNIWIGDAEGQADREELQLAESPVTAVCFSPDGLMLAVAARPAGVVMIDPDTGEKHQSFQYNANEQIDKIVFLSNGGDIAAISANSICVWNTQTSVQTLARHGSSGGTVFAISASGKYCLAGNSVDETREAGIEDIANLRKHLETRFGIRLTEQGVLEFLSIPE